MSDSRRIEGERVYCHRCSNEWDRAIGGLTCPRCEGEFVEILSPGGSEPQEQDPDIPRPLSSPPSDRILHQDPFLQTLGMNSRGPFHDHTHHPLHNHNPWEDVPDPDEDDISTFQFSTPGGRGTFSFTSRTYTSRAPLNQRGTPAMFPFGPLSGLGYLDGRSNTPGRDRQRGPGPGDMQDLFSVILSNMQQAQMQGGGMNGPRIVGGTFTNDARGGGNPFDLLAALFNPGGTGRHGDMVWSQEAFDRILEQLAEQGSNAPPPASADAIQSLPKRKIDEKMLGEDGKAECSICMDNVEIGTEVTTLPCQHWFHEDCVVAWLKEHDTCPHCRQPISNREQGAESSSSRRRVRRSSSVASPFGGDGTRERPFSVPDSPSGVRAARERFYAGRDPPPAIRRTSHPRETSNEYRDQYYGGGQESSEYYVPQPENSQHRSQGGRERRSSGRQERSGGGVTGWLRDHLPGGGGSR